MSKATDRKFRKEREKHYAAERQLEAEKAQARLKGFRTFTPADMTSMVLGVRKENVGPVPVNRRARRRSR